MKDIQFIGVTNHAVDNQPKTTAFIYESAIHDLFGIVYFTGAYWQVLSFGNPIEHELKKKLRIKAAKAVPSDYPIIDNPINFFHDQGKFLKEASAPQKNYITTLYGICPEPLYAQYATSIINLMKVYDLFINQKTLGVHRKVYENEQNNIKDMMTQFKASAEKENFDQFVWNEKLDIISDLLTDYYKKVINPQNGIKLK